MDSCALLSSGPSNSSRSLLVLASHGGVELGIPALAPSSRSLQLLRRMWDSSESEIGYCHMHHGASSRQGSGRRVSTVLRQARQLKAVSGAQSWLLYFLMDP